MNARTEQLLLQKARDGDASGFEQIVAAHSSRMIALAWRLVGNREEAEDIAQEAFLRLHRTLPRFRGDSRVGTWLYRTVSRLAIDHLRRERLKSRIFFFRRSETDSDPVDTAVDQTATADEALLAGERQERLQRALGKVTPRQRAVFVLRHQEELPLKEIAALLDLETGTVKAHLHRAVTVLRKELNDLRKKTP